MARRTRIIDKRAEWDKLRGRVRKIKGARVWVGIPEDSPREEGGLTSAEIGFLMENGVPERNIPARPWFSEALNENKRRIDMLQDKLLHRVMRGKLSKGQALNQLGFGVSSMIKSKLKRGPWAPNAPLTVAKKGHDKPLQDTMQMYNAIKYEGEGSGDNGGGGDE